MIAGFVLWLTGRPANWLLWLGGALALTSLTLTRIVVKPALDKWMRRITEEVVTTLYMPLLDQDTDVWRPVEAIKWVRGSFMVRGPAPEDERWAFPPNVPLRCETKTFANGSQGLVPVARED